MGKDAKMLQLCASLMKDDKNVLSKTSPFDIESLEATTIDLRDAQDHGGGDIRLRWPPQVPQHITEEILGRGRRTNQHPRQNNLKIDHEGFCHRRQHYLRPTKCRRFIPFQPRSYRQYTIRKTKSMQELFIPSASEQFLEMLIVLRFIGGRNSAIAVRA